MAAPNFQNRSLYHGDNLDFLRGMNSETVHLIATDPPFNKNRDFHATPDSLARGARFQDRWSWERDVQGEWVDSIKDDWSAVWAVIEMARVAYGDDMGAFLCWLGVRLMEMRRVLRQDGSIYLHCDPTASHYIKAMMDGIFGRKNFRNEIIWHYYNIASVARKHFGRKHDILFWYSKSATASFNWDDMREAYSPNSNWVRSSESYGDKRYKPNKRGKLMHDVWRLPTINNMAKERTGYPTQKPLALYQRIIKASSKKGDMVLDPFCGCATTPIAAEKLERQWVGMDIWDGAHQTVLARLEAEGLAVPNTDPEQPHLITFGQVHYETQPPIRTDDNEIAAPSFRLKIQRPAQAWEKISRRGMVNILAQAQGTQGGVICGGCGRVLEVEFMELDHITPKSDWGANHILNRILLCSPCNRRKRDNLTLRGLLRENRKKAVNWMKDESRAKMAQSHARDRAEWVRDHFHSPACRALIAGEPA